MGHTLLQNCIARLPPFIKTSAQDQSCPPTVVIEQPKQKPTITANLSDTSSVISGSVKDSQGYPIPFATIMIKGTGTGVSADENGNYDIKLQSLPSTLVFSSVGFYTTEYIVTKFAPAPVNQLLEQALTRITMGGIVVVKKSRKDSKEKRTKEKTIEVTTPSILIYPNPLQPGNDLQIKCSNMEKGKYLAELFSISAQMMQSSHISIQKPSELINLPIKKHFPGNYIIKLTNEKTRKEFSQQLVIQYY